MVLTIHNSVHDPAQRPSLRQLEDLIVRNLRMYQVDGDQNTEGRTSIRDILSTPIPPSSMSTSSTLQNLVREAPVRWTGSGWGAFDEVAAPGAPRRRTARRGRNAIRAVRNVFGGGGGLRNMARRAGRSIRRVFGGAVGRVAGGSRQTRLGNATVDRPEEQRVGRRQTSIGDLQRAMASMGFYPAP